MLEKLNEELQKALDLATGEAAGLYQPEIDKVIADLIDHNNPFRQNLPREAGNGLQYEGRRKTGQTSNTGWVNDTETASTDAAIARSPFNVRYRTILESGGVTTLMQKSGRSFRDLLADEIKDVTQLVKDLEEDGLINGENSVNPKQIDGIRKLLVTAGQELAMAANGANLTLDKLDEAIDLCLGMPDMLLMAKRTRRQLNTLLMAFQSVVNTKEVKGGFRLPAYSDIPIYVSPRISITQEQGSSGAICSDILIVDTEHTFVSDLEPIRMVPLAKTTSQVDKFEIRLSLALILKNTTHGGSRLKGITKT